MHLNVNYLSFNNHPHACAEIIATNIQNNKYNNSTSRTNIIMAIMPVQCRIIVR